MRLHSSPQRPNVLTPISSGGGVRARAFAGGIGLLALIGGLAGCRTVEPSATESSAESLARAQVAVAAYQAYQQGGQTTGCDAARNAAPRNLVRKWPAGEIKYSTRLLHAFCYEREGEIESAREIYRKIVRDAPLTFASSDAKDRLRVLRLLGRDPEYAEWVADAKRRASLAENDASTRPPVERPLASYPPIAREAGIAGFAVVEFGVTPRGETDAPVVVDSKPPFIFDGAALRAVREWQYTKKPNATKSERQIVRITFRLDSEVPSDSGS